MENLPANPNSKILSEAELKSILIKPTPEYINTSDGRDKVLIEGYLIEDEYIILDDSINLKIPLTFSKCIFKSKNAIYFSGITSNKIISFENCLFEDSLYIESGTFTQVNFKGIEAKSISINGGTFSKISISGNSIHKLTISDAKYEQLIIGEFQYGECINKLVIFVDNENSGDISVINQSFDEVSLIGINKGHKIRFEKLICDNFSFHNFKNEGELYFNGIATKGINDKNKYFQIINSNLCDTEFYRVCFPQYNELIIIDSFITDVIFIGCEWSNNIRAQYGPGYTKFEDSLVSGRKYTHEEYKNIKEAYRQLKISMAKHSDKIQEIKFYSEELNFYNKTLKWGKPWENVFWDKLILMGSNYLSNYGQSFIKPLFWLLLGHLILFSIALLLGGFSPLHISLLNPTSDGFCEAFEKFFIYINPLRNIETSLSGYLILLDVIIRIWASFMIYNIIRATRRFIS